MFGIKGFKGTKKAICAVLCTVLLFTVALYPGVNAEGERIVIEPGVNIRNAPGVSGTTVITTTTDYTWAEVTGSYNVENAVWYKIITDGGIEGYVHSDFTEAVGQFETPDFNENDRVIVTDWSNVRAYPDPQAKIIAGVWPCSLECTGRSSGTGGGLWYGIVTPGGQTGYISAACVTEYRTDRDPAFEETLAQFPKNYRAGLRHLHALHPNWIFTADNLSVTFETAVKNERGKKLLSDVFDSLPEDWRSQYSETVVEPGYRPASEKALAYFMSPQFFLTDKAVFMFMRQSYDPALENAEGLKSIVNGSFLDSAEYLSVIIEAAQSTGVSPYVIAGIILQEQGFYGSALCTGSYPGYEGFYNFFNFGATGSTTEEIIATGLSFAASKGWNSPLASIAGGAALYAEGYITRDQDTYFYTDFNLINQSWSYQYATNIHDQINKALNISAAYGAPQATAVFRIPVYKDSDMTPDDQHGHTFGEGTVIKPAAVGEEGIMEYTCTVCGYKRRESIPALTQTPGTPAQIKRGDINGDGVINAIDGALLRLYFLEIRNLEGEQYQRADINNDGNVNTIDGALLRLHFLMIRVIE